MVYSSVIDTYPYDKKALGLPTLITGQYRLAELCCRNAGRC